MFVQTWRDIETEIFTKTLTSGCLHALAPVWTPDCVLFFASRITCTQKPALKTQNMKHVSQNQRVFPSICPLICPLRLLYRRLRQRVLYAIKLQSKHSPGQGSQYNRGVISYRPSPTIAASLHIKAQAFPSSVRDQNCVIQASFATVREKWPPCRELEKFGNHSPEPVRHVSGTSNNFGDQRKTQQIRCSKKF